MNIFKRQSESGFNIVELLIAMALGLSLISLLFVAYNQELQQYRLTHTQLQRQQKQLMLNELFSYLVSRAGLLYCQYYPSSHFINHTLERFDHSRVASILTAENTLSCQTPRSMRNSQIFSIQYTDPKEAVKINLVNQQSIHLSKKISLHDGQKILISDCAHAELVKIQSAHARHLNLASQLQYSYHHPVVMPWHHELYFIAPVKNANGNTRTIRALYRKPCHGVSEELVRGVNQMSIIHKNHSWTFDFNLPSGLGDDSTNRTHRMKLYFKDKLS